MSPTGKILRSLCSLRMTTRLLVIMSASKDLSAQLPGQSFTVTPDTVVATVGDSVHLRFRIRLHERDQLLDTIPQVVGDLPPGVRVLSVTPLRRTEGRVYQGSARVAFYRPGKRPVPIFGLPFMRIVEGITRSTLPGDSAFVEIGRVLPAAGNPALKDIREIDERPDSMWPWAALSLLVAAGAALALRRRRRARKSVLPPPVSTVEPLPAPNPYDLALAQLNRVEAERWPAQGQVALHYDAVAQTLRRYLEDAHDVGALERTTSELLWAMPPHLGRGGLRDRCHEVLNEADLVKFADVRPGETAAGDFLERARGLLTAWHEASRLEESAHALR